jgi:hypothetical protein
MQHVRCPMVEFRAYRIAFAPVLLALAAVMFSLQGAPSPLEPVRPPAAFDPGEAVATAREIVSTAPERPAGSRGDEAIADLVAERFAAIGAASVSEQRVAAPDDDASLRNVVAVLPGDSPQTVVVIAGRDSRSGPGAASSAAATGALVELAAALAATSHRSTYVLVSTSGADSGAEGAGSLLDGLLDPGVVEAIVVLSQPGAAELQPPFVIDSSTGPERTAAQLTATAARAVEAQVRRTQPSPNLIDQVARLAFPSGLGEQAPLIAAGFDAVAISSAGERPLDPVDDGPDDLSRPVLAGFGRAASSIVEAVDVAEAPLEAGPRAYVEVGENLVPGWALALLGLALLCPALVAAVSAIGGALRRSEPLGAGLAWAGSRAVPLLAGLGTLYLLALLGVVPRPSFPFDPGRFQFDARAVIAMTLIAASVVGGSIAVGILRRPRLIPRSALLTSLGTTSVIAGIIAWLANPYLGLLLAPAAHAWLLGTLVGGRARVAITVLGATLSALPATLALGSVASALELGGEAPWTFLLMVAGGQIGPWVALSLCVMAGSLIGIVIAVRPTSTKVRSGQREAGRI